MLEVVYEAAHVPAGHVHIDVSRQHPVLVPNHGRPTQQLKRRKLRQRHLRAGRRIDQDPCQLLRIVPQLTQIAHIDRIALASLNGGGDILATDRGFDDPPDVHDLETIAGDFIAVDLKIEEVTAHDAFRIDAPRA